MSPPGAMPARNTARSADKGSSSPEPDPALVRRLVDAFVILAASAGNPMRRKEARAIILARIRRTNCTELDGWSHWLRDWLDISDPTAISAVRKVTREGR